MKKLLFLTVLLFTFGQSRAQYQSIEKEIENYISAKNITIPNIRELLMRKIEQGLLKDAKLLFRYTTNVYEPKGNLVFYNKERVMISYILWEYDYVLQRIKDIETGIINKKNFYRYPGKLTVAIPAEDQLYNFLTKKLEITLEPTLLNISDGIADKETASVLEIYLCFFMNKDIHTVTTANYINAKAVAFLKNYPNSRYKKFISENVIKNISPKNFRYGMELNFGAQIPKDNMQKLSNTQSNFNIKLNLHYKQNLVQLGYQLTSFTLLKNVIVRNDFWQKDSSLEHHLFNFFAGRFLIDSKRIGLYPNIGATVSFLQPQHNGPAQSRKNKLYSRVAPNIGMELMWKFKKSMDSYSIRKGGDGFGYCAIGMHCTDFTFKNIPEFNGRNITVSFTALAHLAEISTLLFFHWGSRNNRTESW